MVVVGMLSGPRVLRRAVLDFRGLGQVGTDAGRRKRVGRDFVGLKVLLLAGGGASEGECDGNDVQIFVIGRTEGGDWRRWRPSVCLHSRTLILRFEFSV